MCGDLRPYEDFISLCVHNQSAMCNFGAIILFMRRIGTDHNTGWIVSIARSGRITAVPCGIFFLSVCRRDALSYSRRMFLPFSRYTAYARVRALRINGCTEHERSSERRSENVQRFRFHTLFLRKISQPARQTDVCGGKFKKVLSSCVAILPAFSSLLKRYSFSKTRNLSSSI
jgi:hypothetical protein